MENEKTREQLAELALDVMGVLARAGVVQVSVGYSGDEVIVYAPAFVGQIRRIVSQAFPKQPIRVVRAGFRPAEAHS